MRAQLFYFVLWAMLAGLKVLNIMKSYHFLVFLTVWVLFPKILGWVMSELHKIKQLPHVVACPIVCILFNEQCWQGGVYKVMKNDHFLKFLVVWVIFPKFLGKLRSSLYYNCVKWWVLHVHAFPTVSILFYVCDWQGGVLKVIRNDHFINISVSLVFFPKFLARLMSGLY